MACPGCAPPVPVVAAASGVGAGAGSGVGVGSGAGLGSVAGVASASGLTSGLASSAGASFAAAAGSMRSFTVSMAVLPASFARIVLTVSAVIAGALLPKFERTYVRTSAISWSVMVAFGGMALLNAFPLTVMGPLSPRSWILTRFSAGPLTHSDPATGGNTLGMPSPVGPWHAMHLVL